MTILHCPLHALCCMHWFLARNANPVFVTEVCVTLFIATQINCLILTWQKIFEPASCCIMLLLITNTMIASVEILCTTPSLSMHSSHPQNNCTHKPFTSIRTDQEQRIANQRLWQAQITAEMFLSMEIGGGPLMFRLHTVWDCLILVLLLDSRHQSGASGTKETN